MTAWTWLALAVTGYALALTFVMGLCRASARGDCCCRPLTADEQAWDRELEDLSA